MLDETVLIPKSRIAVLIGEKGQDKRAIQKQGRCSLHIDSKTGEVTIKARDAIDLWKASDVVKAIGRGFPPEIARKLFKQDFKYELVSIEDFARSKKDAIRLRGRVIGKQGEAKKHLQVLTQTLIRVQGKTVAIIGEPIRVELARRAIEMLLTGAPHQRVYRFITEQTKNDNSRGISQEAKAGISS